MWKGLIRVSKNGISNFGLLIQISAHPFEENKKVSRQFAKNCSSNYSYEEQLHRQSIYHE